MQFVKFAEHNDWEGETWYFWLQLDGNEAQLKELQTWLNTFDDDNEAYELDMNPVDEVKVDFLLANSDGTDYLHEHNKVVGSFTCPPVTSQAEEDGWQWLNDNFYKGAIVDHFKSS